MDLQQDAKGIVQGAMAYFSSRSGTPAESKAKMMVQEQSPQDISKEDLMALCMKMNKRMHSLEAKLEDIRQKKDTLIEEKKSILLLILNWIGFSCNQSGEEPLDLLILQEAWDRWYSKMRSVTMPDLVSEESAIEERPSTVDSLNSQIHSLSIEIKQKQDAIERLQNQLEVSSTKHEEIILYLQLQIDKYRVYEGEKFDMEDKLKVSSSKIENLEISLHDLSSTLSLLQEQLQERDASLERLRDKNKDLERNLIAATVMKAEQESLLSSIRKDLIKSVDRNKDLELQVADRTTLLETIQMQVAKLSELTQELATCRINEEEKISLIARMRTEFVSNERNHAMRTAMLATCEAQIQNLREELSVKDATCREAIERSLLLQDRLSMMETRIEEKNNEILSEINFMVRKYEAEKLELIQEHQALVDTNAAMVENLKRDFAKKAHSARSLILEKEEEIRNLQVKLIRLEAEIESGAPSERKIFELAEVQAKRDAAYGTHSDSRELAFQQLLHALEAKDAQLADIQQSQSALTAEVVELRRSTRREGVNMDYLKNVVLQYMSFPVNSAERSSLIPVIAMLLQFNSKEIAEVEKTQKDPIWGSRQVKEVKRFLTAAEKG